MNIYLIGMMGSGKSVTGKKLAEFMGLAFVDLDDRIEKKHGRTIADIFQNQGEAFFRREESLLLKEAAKAGRQVIATGGGVILDPSNVESMKKNGRVVYLETSGEMLWQRVREKKGRPLLNGGDPRASLFDILGKRRSLYEKAADCRVATDGQTAEAVARKILAALDVK